MTDLTPDNSSDAQLENGPKVTWPYVVTVDGPAGSGKSKLGIALADYFQTFYLDSGKVYRALGLAAMRANIRLDCMSDDLKSLAASLDIVFAPGETFGRPRVLLAGEDVTDLLKGEENSNSASLVSKFPAIRYLLLPLQQSLGKNGCVTVGRDMGTIVFPKADVKIFLDADIEARAFRRYCQNRGVKAESIQGDSEIDAIKSSKKFSDVIDAINERDERDRSRTVAPLMKPEDAIVLDNTNLNTKQTVEAAISIVETAVSEDQK